MKTNYDFYDRKTPEMVAALRQLWLDLAEVERLEPGFGSYPPDLDFGPGEMSSSFTDNSGSGNGKHWHFAPDQHYFQAQGVSPLAPTPAPAQAEEPRVARTLRSILTWCLVWVLVGELVLLLWPGLL